MNPSTRGRSFCLIGALGLLLIAGPVAAQSAATGNLEGVITDVSGGVLPGVIVVIRNVDTNVSRQVVTDESGRYRVLALQPGRYEVAATLSGFDARPVTDILVQIGQTVPVDIQMRPAGIAESVNVTAEAPVIDTRRTDVSNVISTNALQNLPITGRRWDNFVLLSPGVTNDGNFGLVTYRGISGLYNNNMVDGVDNNQAFFSEARGRTRTVYSISESSIKEFQVGISNMSAEFGRAAGGTVNAVTKSGTNRFGGEGFYFIRDDAWQARNPYVVIPGDPKAKPDERRQQFGAGIGGPIRKDKVFFFADYDQQVRRFPAYTSPSNATFLSSSCSAPAANCAATLAFFNALIGLSPREGNNKVGFGKIDVTMNQSESLSLSYNAHRWNSPNGVQAQPVITVASSANGSDNVTTDFVVGSLNSILSQRWLNEFRFQAGRDYEEQIPNGVPPSTTVTGGINFGMPNFLPRPAFPHEQRYQFVDSITYYRGAHLIKSGADVNFVRDLQINLFNGGVTYAYSNFSDLALDCPIGASGCLPAEAGALTGRHYTSYQQAFDLNNLAGKIAFNTSDYNFFVQDTWRASNELLLNVGLRYEYQQLPQPGKVKVDDITFSGNPAYPLTRHFNQDRSDWGPRLGVTYDFGRRHETIIRGGYGIYYGRTSNSAIANALINTGVAVANYFITPTTAGSPAYPVRLSAPPTIAGGRPDVQWFSTELKRPMIQSGDVTLDRQFSGLTLSASYLYSRGSRLPLFRDINLPAANSQVHYVLDGQTVGTFPFYRGARPDSSATRIIVLEPIVTSVYHALVLAANRTFANGVLLNANYTLSKAEDNGQNSATFFGGNQPYDAMNLDLVDGRSTSDFDRRHRFVGSFLYQPIYLTGIGISGVVTIESGLPISQNISGSLAGGVGAVNTSSTNGSGGATFAPWIGRNTERYPGRNTVDLRLSRRFAVGGTRQIEVLWEAFNLFNRKNPTLASSTAYNVSSSTYDAASNIATVNLSRNSGFLVPTSASNVFFGPRDMQLGVRLMW